MLVDRELKGLPPGEHYDGKIPGLSFRVRETGGKSWALHYRINGRRRRYTIGAYPALGLGDARVAAKKALKRVAMGDDPAAEKIEKREVDTFGDLAGRYIETWAKPRKRTWKNDQWLLDAHVLPSWRNRPAKEIARSDVRLLLEKVSKKAPIGVNRVRALVSKVFAFGVSVDVIEHGNPVAGTMPAKETSRSRVLTEDEVRKLWDATKPSEEMHVAMSARFRLPLVTAQRGGEVNGMKWSDLDLDTGVWTIPAEHSKNGLAHRVPLSSLALEIINQLPRSKSEYVLSRGRGKRQQREAAATFGLDDFRGHDLRRTAASMMTSMGISRFVVGRILNHAEAGVTAIYDRHSYDLEKRDALNRWAMKLRSIIANERAEVVEMKLHA